MSYRNMLLQMEQAFGKNVYFTFLLDHGRDFVFTSYSFEGPRGEQHECYANATKLATDNRDLTYVEGKIMIHGVPLDHAWCVDANDVVVDPTVTDTGQVTGYYGVPFQTEYVLRAMLVNERYGVLDVLYAEKTAPKLYELGLTIGQLWLLNQPTKKQKRQRRAAIAALGVGLFALFGCVDARAQDTQTFRNSNGQEIGRSVTNNAGTTYYNSLGQNTGRSVTNNAGTTFYNSQGQQTGRVSGGRSSGGRK